MNRDVLLENIVSTVKIAKLFDLPIVYSTIIVGTPAAIANAAYHATGVRVRDLPITLDKLLQRSPWSEHRTQIDILGKSERKLRITPGRSFRSLIPAVPFWEEEAGGLSLDQIVSGIKPSLGHIPIPRDLNQNDG